MSQPTILTGDLIGSTRSTPRATTAAMTALADAADTISAMTGAATRFTRSRGDGWQLYLPDTTYALRATLLLLAALQASRCGLTTRLSMAVGTVDSLGSADLADASGPAFVQSGRNLDKMTAQADSFAFAHPDPSTRFWQKAILDMAVARAKDWTPEQAEAAAMALALPRPTDEDLANRLGITRQAFQSRLKGSALRSMSAALLAFEHPDPQG